ncbi:MAG: inverse autotransporter beta domain-containing protein, partial [Methyloligellaceae bacterium]
MARAFVLAMLVFTGAGAAFAGGLKGGPGPHNQSKKWLPWYESGGFLSSEEHRVESNLFVPLWQSSVALLFFEGSGKLFEDDIQEGNFDIGFRKMHRSGWNFGLWGGYDVRDTEIDNIFHQISFGVEALSDRWDVRANGYVAISDPAGAPEQARVLLQGTSIVLVGGEEVPLSGFDGEVGYKIFGRRGGHKSGLKDGPVHGGRSHELRVFAGGFYFDDSDALDEVAGPRARIEWRIDDVISWLPGSRLTFEGEFQYDDVREDQWEGGVRLRIPFGGGAREARAVTLASLTLQERRMTEGIVRDPDIITVESKAENVFDLLTGVVFDRAAVVPGGGPLQQTIDANGPNSLIILDGGTTNGSFTLGPSQTLQGGASTIQVTGVKSGVTANFTAPGSKPFLVNTQNSAVLTIASNTH